MSDPVHTDLSDLECLFSRSYVQSNKIQCIKLVRQISGAGLREAKNFVENDIINAIVDQKAPALKGRNTFDELNVDDLKEDSVDEVPDNLPPPMYLVGNSYKQLDGCTVLVLGVANPNSTYETVYTMGSDGNVIHRYNRRDFGRCTGSDHEIPDPRNLVKLTKGQF